MLYIKNIRIKVYLKNPKSKSKFHRKIILIPKLILINIKNQFLSLLVYNINLYINIIFNSNFDLD